MTTLKAHFDGKQIVLDEPMPKGVAPNTPVTVLIQGSDNGSSLEELAKMARPCGLPPDFSEQHEHYTKGTPKR